MRPTDLVLMRLCIACIWWRKQRGQRVVTLCDTGKCFKKRNTDTAYLFAIENKNASIYTQVFKRHTKDFLLYIIAQL